MEDDIEISIIEEGIDSKDLVQFLEEIDQDFKPPLSEKVLIPDYARKLNANAYFAIAFLEKELIGLTAFYANDPTSKESYLPVIGVRKTNRGKGVADKMLKAITSFLSQKGFHRLSLETWQGNPAQVLYHRNNFVLSKIEKDRIGDLKSLKMFKWIAEVGCENSSHYSSPLEYHHALSEEYSINLFIKRDDLYPKFGGGNKARKLDYIINKARVKGYNAIVTTGSANSNHCRAAALYAASIGWKIMLIIHDEEPEAYEGNLKLMKLSGAEIKFVKHSEVKESMDKAIKRFETKGYKPLYIWGGGHSIEGALAYYEAIKEIKRQLQNLKPDYLVVASGTGTTQAGLEVGVRQFFPGCKIIGASVAREKERGKKEIMNSMRELNDYLGNPINLPRDIHFDTEVCEPGYEKVFPDLLETVQEGIKKGLLLDPTYSGKAFQVLKTYVLQGKIHQGSNVLFWHTGGLMNLLTSSKF